MADPDPTRATLPTIDDLRAAAGRLRGVVRRTPVIAWPELAREIGAAEVVLKCENLQVSGAFKYRGASNAVLATPPEWLGRGVATHSSGNHGTALALAARRAGVPAYVVVPETCARPKLEAIRAAGAEVTICAATKAAREAAVAEVVARTGATLVHPYDDVLVIAGQATATLELLEDAPGLDVLLAPVSGGGLLAGTALAAKGFNPAITVYAAEPELAADAAQTFRTKKLAGPEAHTGFTVADGLRAALSERTMRAMLDHVAGVLTVSEEQIVAAMRRAWAETRMIIEPSCSVPVAAVIANPALFAGKRVGIIITGGNVDLEKLPWQK